ncbi:MAG: pilus assembly protein TadG-related protein, partial [Bacillota bacterium]
MVIVALFLTLLLLFTGLALDLGRAHLLRAQLQTAVDAGALA